MCSMKCTGADAGAYAGMHVQYVVYTALCQISFLVGVHSNTTSLHLRVSDNQISLNFGIMDNCLFKYTPSVVRDTEIK